MKCFHPLKIRAPGESGIKSRFRWIEVPCGKCIACMRKRQNDWAIRLMTEKKYCNGEAYFLTLTQDDEHIRFSKQGYPTLCKKDMQDFWKRVNEYCRYRGLPSPRVFYVGEYGDSYLRPHYHAVAFNLPGSDYIEVAGILEKLWKRGFVTASSVTPGRCKYVAKYCCKGLLDDSPLEGTDVVRPFAEMSRRPGIGYRFNEDRKAQDYYARNGIFVLYDEQATPYAVPRYFYNRIYSLSQWKDHVSSCEIGRFMADLSLYDKNGSAYYRNLIANSQDYEALLWKRLRDSKSLSHADKGSISRYTAFMQR